MTRAQVAAICAGLPGAEVSDPWGGGHDCWKVGDKIFAVTGAVDQRVSVKTDGVEAAALLIEMGAATKARYLHASWVTLNDDLPEDELRARLRRSYALVRAGLTKKAQAALGEWTE